MSAIREIIQIVGEIAAQWRQTSINLAKIEASIYYVKAMRAARLLMLGIAGFVGALVLFFCGWILLHVALIFLIPWEPDTRILVAFALAAINILVPSAGVFYFLSEKGWMKLTHSDKVVKDVT